METPKILYWIYGVRLGTMLYLLLRGLIQEGELILYQEGKTRENTG